MATRNIELIVKPSTPHFVGDGFRVMTLIPSGSGLSMQRMNPFIMMDYNPKFHFPPSTTPKGVGVHPHRGFETVTIAYKGKVAHHDSSGGGGVISEGDVQWMTAASGVLHKEYHEEEFSKTGGEFQMVQLWVNLPAKHKMSAPKYQAISKDSISKVELPANRGQVEIIAGSYEGAAGAASTFTPIHLFNTRLKSGGTASFSFPENFNTGLLVLEGKVKINATQAVDTDHFALFENKGEDFQVSATDDAVFLILSGQPIHEPIAAHGPFVMNSKEELIQAFQDFNEGKFGYLS
ncbi:pirin family protein [Algoriphagus resistens]|uniref:pirin family protein n=1 Tax=Algoriphagus resistens TaxID=1750590 RepID=UPI0007168581|nr:pirin family protein [Algoriphagus resistens]